MFGVIAAGRAVNLNCQPVGENKFLMLLDDAASVNHFVLFTVPGAPVMPSDIGAAIYLAWPPYASWKLMGFVSTNKPSAMFRITGMAPAVTSASRTSISGDIEMKLDPITAQLGISIEPLASIQQQLESQKALESNTMFNAGPTPTTIFGGSSPSSIMNSSPSGVPIDQTQEALRNAQAMLQHLFNYCMSFAKPAYPGAPIDSIPSQTFMQWYKTFEARLLKDPNFYKTQ